MIYQSCNTKIIVGHDNLVRIENLAHFKSNLSFLKGTRQILDTHDYSTYAYVHAGVELAGKSVRNRPCKLFQVL